MLVIAITKLVSLLLLHVSSAATDTLTQSQPLHDGETLISKDGTFELGFFRPAGTSTSSSSTNRYIGIWYRNIPERTIVWVANREEPVRDNSSSTTLTINSQGRLVILSHNETTTSTVWSSKGFFFNNLNSSTVTVMAQLLDSGNLVLIRNEEQDDENVPDNGNYIWQSFDYPCDTFLPGMKIGWDLRSGLNRRLTAWKRWDDPSPGDFTMGIVLGVTPELVMFKGSQVYQRSPWNGVKFGGKSTPIFGLQFIVNQDEVVYTSTLKDKTIITRVVLNQTTYHRDRYLLDKQTKTWKLYSSVPKDNCDSYNPCGPNGNCIPTDSPRCHCLPGLKPKSLENYNALDWTQGCVRSDPWSCGVKNKDGFRKFSALKMPDTAKAWGNASMTLEECKAKCLQNCSCKAYANLYITEGGGGGTGCLIWLGDLVDMRVASDPGQDLYIRMAASDTDAKEHKKKMVVLVVTIIVPILVLVMLLTYSCMRRRKRNRKRREKTLTNNSDEGKQEDLELPYFDLATIVQATNDFSSHNKLGQGGFGPVYRGFLRDGQEIAVKRLSQSSGQGLKEFKNEVIMCAKLQHRNLVKVLGCCIEGEEKMLIYEYMPNKSLDSVLFGCDQSSSLNWSQRFHIIFGIARGILYLHQDSRLRIIHRDLKASNVLLDKEFNPKISDFGMARMFRGDQIEGNTNRVVGTYGYMAPEYAIHGLFSIKSDVFSFGVLLLEIISGKKNRGAPYPNHGFNLIGHAWKLWKEGNTKELIDCCLGDAFNLLEALRCIHVSLLCVQQHPEDRPNMALVLVMLSSESVLPQPKEPGFLIENSSMEGEYSSNKQMMFSSSNEITMTLLHAR